MPPKKTVTIQQRRREREMERRVNAKRDSSDSDYSDIPYVRPPVAVDGGDTSDTTNPSPLKKEPLNSSTDSASARFARTRGCRDLAGLFYAGDKSDIAAEGKRVSKPVLVSPPVTSSRRGMTSAKATPRATRTIGEEESMTEARRVRGRGRGRPSGRAGGRGGVTTSSRKEPVKRRRSISTEEETDEEETVPTPKRMAGGHNGRGMMSILRGARARGTGGRAGISTPSTPSTPSLVARGRPRGRPRGSARGLVSNVSFRTRKAATPVHSATHSAEEEEETESEETLESSPERSPPPPPRSQRSRSRAATPRQEVPDSEHEEVGTRKRKSSVASLPMGRPSVEPAVPINTKKDLNNKLIHDRAREAATDALPPPKKTSILNEDRRILLEAAQKREEEQRAAIAESKRLRIEAAQKLKQDEEKKKVRAVVKMSKMKSMLDDDVPMAPVVPLPSTEKKITLRRSIDITEVLKEQGEQRTMMRESERNSNLSQIQSAWGDDIDSGGGPQTPGPPSRDLSPPKSGWCKTPKGRPQPPGAMASPLEAYRPPSTQQFPRTPAPSQFSRPPSSLGSGPPSFQRGGPSQHRPPPFTRPNGDPRPCPPSPAPFGNGPCSPPRPPTPLSNLPTPGSFNPIYNSSTPSFSTERMADRGASTAFENLKRNILDGRMDEVLRLTRQSPMEWERMRQWKNESILSSLMRSSSLDGPWRAGVEQCLLIVMDREFPDHGLEQAVGNRSLLHWAIRTAKIKAAKLLISKGASVNEPYTVGVNPGQPETRMTCVLLELVLYSSEPSVPDATSLAYEVSLAGACPHLYNASCMHAMPYFDIANDNNRKGLHDQILTGFRKAEESFVLENSKQTDMEREGLEPSALRAHYEFISGDTYHFQPGTRRKVPIDTSSCFTQQMIDERREVKTTIIFGFANPKLGDSHDILLRNFASMPLFHADPTFLVNNLRLKMEGLESDVPGMSYRYDFPNSMGFAPIMGELEVHLNQRPPAYPPQSFIIAKIVSVWVEHIEVAPVPIPAQVIHDYEPSTPTYQVEDEYEPTTPTYGNNSRANTSSSEQSVIVVEVKGPATIAPEVDGPASPDPIEQDLWDPVPVPPPQFTASRLAAPSPPINNLSSKPTATTPSPSPLRAPSDLERKRFQIDIELEAAKAEHEVVKKLQEESSEKSFAGMRFQELRRAQMQRKEEFLALEAKRTAVESKIQALLLAKATVNRECQQEEEARRREKPEVVAVDLPKKHAMFLEDDYAEPVLVPATDKKKISIVLGRKPSLDQEVKDDEDDVVSKTARFLALCQSGGRILSKQDQTRRNMKDGDRNRSAERRRSSSRSRSPSRSRSRGRRRRSRGRSRSRSRRRSRSRQRSKWNSSQSSRSRSRSRSRRRSRNRGRYGRDERRRRRSSSSRSSERRGRCRDRSRERRRRRSRSWSSSSSPDRRNARRRSHRYSEERMKSGEEVKKEEDSIQATQGEKATHTTVNSSVEIKAEATSSQELVVEEASVKTAREEMLENCRRKASEIAAGQQYLNDPLPPFTMPPPPSAPGWNLHGST